MSNWTLTHISEETSLLTQETCFFLIFDNGKYRVPVSQEVLRTFLKQLTDESQVNGAATPPSAEVADDEVVDESGVSQF